MFPSVQAPLPIQVKIGTSRSNKNNKVPSRFYQ